jgi:hypothetical protein
MAEAASEIQLSSAFRGKRWACSFVSGTPPFPDLRAWKADARDEHQDGEKSLNRRDF